MKAYFRKVPIGFVPDSEDDSELLSKIKLGEVVSLEFKRPRNYKFLKKFMALMHLAFDYWEVPESGHGSAWAEKVPVEKNFDQFRKQITAMAGFHNAVYLVNGDVRFEAKSISFGKMSEDEFEKLYSACIQVILNKVCTTFDEDTLRRTVEDMILEFV